MAGLYIHKVVDYVSGVLGRDEGQDMIEYALLAGVVSIAAIAVIVLTGPYLKDFFQNVVNAFGMT